ncbi:MAG: aminotransferase class V-fold PLP-dependent enzyme [Pseudomonadota bacterium]
MLIPAFDFDALRAREFARLDAHGVAYLDYAAGALYGESQVRAYADRLSQNVYGNPHSTHAPSALSASDLDAARVATLEYFDADPDVYDVCFAANTSGALKLVAEAYPFGPHKGLTLSADNHNSVNGAREYARCAGASVSVLPIDGDLRLEEPAARMRWITETRGPGLLAFPVQSNFSGVRHELSLVNEAQALGFDVLVDAAGACSGFSLRAYPADFVAFAYYKLFGLPTGLGALIAKRAALAKLQRPWFAGGAVDFVSVAFERHRLSAGHAGFEDGTPNFLNVGAVAPGFDFLARIPRASLQHRIEALTRYFLQRAGTLTHADGAPLVRFYGPRDLKDRGGTLAFNMLDRQGRAAPYGQIEQRAQQARVALRGGCFCNPGAAERAFGLASPEAERCFETLADRFSVPAFQSCLGPDVAVGALRVSVGAATSFADLDRCLEVLAAFSETSEKCPISVAAAD